MSMNLKPPWKQLFLSFQGFLMLTLMLIVGMTSVITAHAEEQDPWYESFSYELDDTDSQITLTKVNDGVEDVVVKGTATIDGREYHTLVDSNLFQNSDKEAIKTIAFEGGVSFPSFMRRMFYELKNVESITFSPEIDTREVSDMVNLFNGCEKLKAVDLGAFKVPKVRDLDGIFAYCESLESVNLNGFEPGVIDAMYGTFRGCTSLETLDLSTLHTGSCKTFYCTFYKCTALKNLNLSHFETGSATSLANIFDQCSSLERLDLSGFDTSNVTSFSGMLNGCTSLKEVNLSSFDTAKGTSFGQMFSKCSALEQLDVSGFSTVNATDLSSMFYGCSGLKELDLSGFSTAKVTQISSMFRGCSSLTSLDLSNFDTSQVSELNYIFTDCSSLTELNITGWNTEKVTEMRSSFSYCGSLEILDLSGFDLSALTNSYNIMNNGMDSLREIRTPKAMSAVSVPLPAFFAEKDAAGDLKTDCLYTLLEEAPLQTVLYRVPVYSVIFYADAARTESKTQNIVRDTDTPLALNTFTNEGKVFLGWGTYSSATAASYADGEVVRDLAAENGTKYLYAIWGNPRGFTFVIPARASFTMLSTGTFGAEIPYSIIYTGRNADCVRVSPDVGKLRDAFGNELSLNCWNTRPTWFVMTGGGGTLNEATGYYEGTGVITVSVNSGYLAGAEAGLYTGTLTVTVGYL